MFTFSKTSKKLGLALMTGLLAVGLLAGCGSDTKSGEASQKVLRVGAETTFPPFEFTEGDKAVGFDIDLAEAVAKKIGYKFEFKSMGFDALIPALQSQNIDLIASGMTYTEERAKVVAFSKPYYEEGGFVVIVRNDNQDIMGVDGLAGKKVGAQIGNVSVEIAEKAKAGQVKSVDSTSQLFTELKTGTLDAVVLDNPVARYYLKQGADKDLKIVGTPVEGEPYVMATRKNDKELTDKVNKALDELKADGTYNKLVEKWFGASKK